jgi:O-6-methylguanine DNA methyltransferase
MKKRIFKTELGWSGVAASDKGICRIVLPKLDRKTVERELANAEREMQNAEEKEELILEKTVLLLKRYFSGKDVLFDLPLDLRYYTPFQQAVWSAAGKIPFGQTRSYAWIAAMIKKPLAMRAVGGALGANPVPVIIPCHRVISSTGTLGGFSGGLGIKKKLLDLEKSRARINPEKV